MFIFNFNQYENSNTMKVTTIITSYNRADTLEGAIRSVLEQSVESEVIIVDDGSTDGSVEIIKKYGGAARCFYNDHAGMMQTYQFAISKCSGEYICFCDCDDYWTDKNKLKNQTYFMDINTDCGICAFDCSPKHTIGSAYDRLLIRDTLLAPTIMIRRSHFEKYCNFDEYLGYPVWDYPIIPELAKKTKILVHGMKTAEYCKGRETVTQTDSRVKRLKYLSGIWQIRLHFIFKYGCKISTLPVLCYRLCRDVYSIIFKRWNK